MSPLESRRSERIDYRAPVELVAHAQGADLQVLGRSLDLGAGGMQLWVPVQMQVGAAVTCRVALDGRPASLPARVAWLRALDPMRHGEGHGMGVCFEALGSQESALVNGVIARSIATTRSVQLKIEGLENWIEVDGELREHGIRLSAPLPVLTRGGALSFRLDPDGPLFTGTIGHARLHETRGERRLEVDLLVDGWETARSRRHAHYVHGAEVEASSDPALPAHEQANERRRITQLSGRTRASRRGRWLALGSCIVAAAATVGWSSWRSRVHSREVDEFVVRPRKDVEPARTSPPIAINAASDPLPRGTSEPTLSSAGPWQRTPALDATRVSSAEAANPDIAITRTDNAISPDTEGPLAVASQPAAPAEPDTSASLATEPQVFIGTKDAMVRIPFEGTLDEMRVRVWSDPTALAVDLPHGRTSLALGRHVVNRGAVGDLQLNARGEQLLLRIKVSQPVSDYNVAVAEGALEVRLGFARAKSAATALE